MNCYDHSGTFNSTVWQSGGGAKVYQATANLMLTFQMTDVSDHNKETFRKIGRK